MVGHTRVVCLSDSVEIRDPSYQTKNKLAAQVSATSSEALNHDKKDASLPNYQASLWENSVRRYIDCVAAKRR